MITTISTLESLYDNLVTLQAVTVSLRAAIDVLRTRISECERRHLELRDLLSEIKQAANLLDARIAALEKCVSAAIRKIAS